MVKHITAGWLSVNDKNPDLFGEAILLSDDDGIGFALDLAPLIGKYVRVTIEAIDPQPTRVVDAYPALLYPRKD